MTMPRLYFDVWEGATFIQAEEGLEFDSLDVAEYQAARMAAEIGQDRLPKGEDRLVTV